jgi:C-22 sterol desaturase
VPLAKDILGHKAWVFLQGKAHAEYRRGLAPLFTNKAMATYLPAQEKVLAEYFDKFVAASAANDGRPMAFMTLFREINCALSCRAFFGDYISPEAVKKIANDFYHATAALELVNVPFSIYIPFTKPWRGKRTADAVHAEFAKCAAACKRNMAAGAAPTCVVDHWVQHMFESNRNRERIAAGETDVEKPANLIREFTNEEISETLFTFLFASQDASSSATTWLFQILAQRPDVLNRLREENLAARGGDRSTPFDLPMLESLTYTAAVIKELLRYRPPVIFVPYLATKPFPITPEYTAPKGALVIPSCYPALHDPQAYPNPDVFDPDRWITGDAEKQTRNWLVFGAGAHDCLARRYVPLVMAAMIGKAALELDWRHVPTERSEEIKVFATLFPMVSTPCTFCLRSGLLLTNWCRMGRSWFLRNVRERKRTVTKVNDRTTVTTCNPVTAKRLLLSMCFGCELDDCTPSDILFSYIYFHPARGLSSRRAWKAYPLITSVAEMYWPSPVYLHLVK